MSPQPLCGVRCPRIGANTAASHVITDGVGATQPRGTADVDAVGGVVTDAADKVGADADGGCSGLVTDVTCEVVGEADSLGSEFGATHSVMHPAIGGMKSALRRITG
ncbi:MAG: hypothetical protein FWD63_09150 [Propionibacteriaceae bacterium]|nr:hypothetical protein [Propionibacteriaceae bacterium]